MKLQEQEFFATREPAIAEAQNAAARKRPSPRSQTTDPALLAEFNAARRKSEAESQFLRGSGRYPLCGAGDVNTYSVFAEHFRATSAPHGRSGIITPTGLATDATTAAFFADTVAARRLAAFYDFENEAKIFDGVHHAFRFAVSSMTGGERVDRVKLAFCHRQSPTCLREGSPWPPTRSCCSTRTPGPSRSSVLVVTPRSRWRATADTRC